MTTGVNVGVTAAANAIPEIWSKQAQMAVEKNLVLEKLIDHQYEKEITFGDTVHVTTVANLTAVAKVEGDDVTFAPGTMGTLPISIDKNYIVPFKVEEMARVQANIDIISKYTDKAGYAIAAARDKSIADLYSDLGQYVGSGSVVLTDALILEAVVKLDQAEAPSNDRSFVVTPAVKGQILGIDKFTRYDSLGTGVAITDGKVGNIYGLTVYCSSNIQQEAATPAVDHNLMFQKEAFAMVTQIQPVFKSMFQVKSDATECTLKSLWGVAEMRDTFAVDVRTITTLTT